MLVQKVIKPTRKQLGQFPMLEEWVLVNDDKLVSEVRHLDPLGRSDHVLTFQLYILLGNENQHRGFIYNFNEGIYDKLRDIMRNHDWSGAVEMDVNEAWCYIKSVIHSGMEECITQVRIDNKRKIKSVSMNSTVQTVITNYTRYCLINLNMTCNYIQEMINCTKLIRKS